MIAVVPIQEPLPSARLVEISKCFLRTVNREAVVLESARVVVREVEAVGVNAVVTSVDSNDVHVLAVRVGYEHVDSKLVRRAGVGWFSATATRTR
jgi:hypothetical protein